MHRISLRWLWLLVILSGTISMTACGDDDDNDDDATPGDDDAADDDDDDLSPGDDDDDVTPGDDDDDDASPWPENEWINEGKWWLALGDGDRANVYFRLALEEVPAHPEANYGLVIGNTLHMTEIISILWDYIDSLSYGGPVKADEDNILDTFLDEVMNGLLFANALEQFEYVEICREHHYTFRQSDPIPIIIHFEHFDDISGRFEDAALDFSLILPKLLWGLVGQLTALSLDFDITYALPIMDLDWDDWLPALQTTVDILQALLNDPMFPDFLTLPPENLADFQEAGLQLAGGFDAYLSMLDNIETDTHGRPEDVVGFVDLNGNGVWNYHEPYRIPGFGELDEEEMVLFEALRFAAEKLRNSLWDYTEYDVDPENLNPFHMAYLNPLLDALGLPPLIPDWGLFELDLGAVFADPGEDGFKDLLIIIVNLADLILDMIGEAA